jgi:hypothetical protein
MGARLSRLLDLCTPIELARAEAETTRGILERTAETGNTSIPHQELSQIAMCAGMLNPDDQATYRDLVDEAHEARSLALAVSPLVGGAAVARYLAQQGGQGWQCTADLAALVSNLSVVLLALLAALEPSPEEPEPTRRDAVLSRSEFAAALETLASVLPALEAHAARQVTALDTAAQVVAEGPVKTGEACLARLDKIRLKLGGTDTIPPVWREQLEEGLSILR